MDVLKIQIDQKTYGDQCVLRNLNLELEPKGIYGVVGKNGSGKTTFFKCVMGLEQFEGTIAFGAAQWNASQAVWCPTEVPLYDELTAVEFYRYYSRLFRNSAVLKRENLLFEVPSNQLIKDFSTGMKKKVYFNALFQQSYAVYIFDEPFNGLDIESNLMLINKIQELAKLHLILISSHLLESLYKICHQIYVLEDKSLTAFSRENYSQIESRFL